MTAASVTIALSNTGSTFILNDTLNDAGRYVATRSGTNGSPAVANRTGEQRDDVVGDRGAVGTGDGDEHAARLTVPRPRRERFRDAGVAAREVLIVLERDDAIEHEDRDRRVVARAVARLRLVAAGRGLRIRRALEAERAR